MVSAGGLRQDTAGCRCVRLRVLALRRVGKRGAFARTVVTLGRPPGRRERGEPRASRGDRQSVQRSDGHDIESNLTQY